MIELYVKAAISDSFCQLIQSGNYEKLILSLMNQSLKVFPSQYQHNDDQAHGECDFWDIKSGQKYDVKLAFGQTEGRLISSKQNDIGAWFSYMAGEEAEFSRCISSEGVTGVEHLRLYKTMARLVEKINSDEHAIFFIPYPIAMDGKDMYHVIFATDILSAIFSQLCKSKISMPDRVYVIYPAMDTSIVLRCLNTNIREYIDFSELDQHISYRFSLNGGRE